MKLYLSFIFLLFALSSCSIVTKKKTPILAPPNINKQFSIIKHNVEASSNQKHLNSLIAFINDNPENSLTDDALLLFAKSMYKKKNYLKAYTAYMKIIRSDFYSPSEHIAILGAAKSLNQRGQYDEAISLTHKLTDDGAVNLDLKQKAYKLQYSLYTNLQNYRRSFDALIGLYELENNPEEKVSIFSKAISLIEGKMSTSELASITNKYENKTIQSSAYLNLGTMALEDNKSNQAKDYFQKVIQISPGSSRADIAEGFLQQFASREQVDAKTIGVILPLSGKYEKIARKVLKGIQLGLNIFGKNRSNFQLAVIDSEANPDIARRSVEKLVTENHVIAIIGGMLGRTSAAISSAANRLSVPNITLSQKANLTQIGDYVFRNALTSKMQITKLVETAMKKDLKRFAILYPEDTYGKEYFTLFWEEVKNQGGTIVGVEKYPPGETDFNQYIKRLVGTYYIKDREVEYKSLLAQWKKEHKNAPRHKTPTDLLPAIIDFDALFIPDNSKTVGQIAPMLAYNDVRDIVLLGTNLWDSPSFIQRGQKYVENSLFIAPPKLSPQKLSTTSFYKKFYALFKYPPGDFETKGYDTGKLVQSIILSGNTNRRYFKNALNELSNFSGVNGPLQMFEQELIQPLDVLTVSKGQFKIIK